MSMQQTPLHYAACNYELDTVRFLVQEGCSVLAVDNRGRTAVDAIKVPRDARALVYRPIFQLQCNFVSLCCCRRALGFRIPETKQTRQKSSAFLSRARLPLVQHVVAAQRWRQRHPAYRSWPSRLLQLAAQTSTY